MKYLVISRTEDEVHSDIFEASEKEELERQLIEEWGEDYKFLKNLPRSLDEFPSMSLFIMKGDVIKPKAVQVVKHFELE